MLIQVIQKTTTWWFQNFGDFQTYLDVFLVYEASSESEDCIWPDTLPCWPVKRFWSILRLFMGRYWQCHVSWWHGSLLGSPWVFMMCATGNGLLFVSVDLFMTQFVGVKLFLHNSLLGHFFFPTLWDPHRSWFETVLRFGFCNLTMSSYLQCSPCSYVTMFWEIELSRSRIDYKGVGRAGIYKKGSSLEHHWQLFR
jgi:hypothetical protein